jgi:conjugative transposon TraN protein
MKQFFLLLAIAASSLTTAGAQEDTQQTAAEANPSKGDFFNGLTRPLTFQRMIAPYALEVTYSKTVHILFPAAIRYVDLGSSDLLAAKADGAENVLRVKAAVQGFTRETNLSVITEDGSYYAFNVRYADEPVKLSVEMASFLKDNKQGHELPVYLNELGNESPKTVQLIMETVYKNNRQKVKHIDSKRFGIRYRLKGIYTHGGLLYLHTELRNASHLPFDVEYVSFKIVDRKVARRTAMQETVIHPVRTYNDAVQVEGKCTERTVFVLPKFTLADDKRLLVELLTSTLFKLLFSNMLTYSM